MELQHPSSEYSGLISFRTDWFDLLALQGTLRSLLQHHSLKALILWRSAFFIVQLSQPRRTAGETIALTKWTFVSKVMSLLFSSLSRFLIAFLPRSKQRNSLQEWGCFPGPPQAPKGPSPLVPSPSPPLPLPPPSPYPLLLPRAFSTLHLGPFGPGIHPWGPGGRPLFIGGQAFLGLAPPLAFLSSR